LEVGDKVTANCKFCLMHSMMNGDVPVCPIRAENPDRSTEEGTVQLFTSEFVKVGWSGNDGQPKSCTNFPMRAIKREDKKKVVKDINCLKLESPRELTPEESNGTATPDIDSIPVGQQVTEEPAVGIDELF